MTPTGGLRASRASSFAIRRWTWSRLGRWDSITMTAFPSSGGGVRAGKKEDKMGWRASDTRELIMEDALVPEGDRLGEEGEGFTNFMKTLDSGRIGIAALSLGLAEGAFDTAIRYANEREQFGDKIWSFHNIQFQLADIATDIQAGKHLTYHAAWLKD